MACGADIMVSLSLGIILNAAVRIFRKLKKYQLYARVLLLRTCCIGYWAFPIPVNSFINGALTILDPV